MGFEISGLDGLQKKLSDIDDRAKNLEGTHSVSFEKLFTREFMSKHTKALSFDDFLEAGGFDVNSAKDFEAIPDDVFDAYVSKSTDFDTWEEMQGTATEIYVANELGL